MRKGFSRQIQSTGVSIPGCPFEAANPHSRELGDSGSNFGADIKAALLVLGTCR